MSDHATPNLPSRDYSATIAFYAELGFETSWHDENWLILEQGDLILEFFHYPDLQPAESAFSCCLRLDDMLQFYQKCIDTNIPEQTTGWPRVHAPRTEPSGMLIAHLVDLDGTLLRLVQN